MNRKIIPTMTTVEMKWGAYTVVWTSFLYFSDVSWGESENQRQDGDAQGIPHQFTEVCRREKTPEMLQSGPGTSVDTVHHAIVLECQLETIHRIEAENQEIGDRRQQEEIERPVLPDQLPPHMPFPLSEHSSV